MFVLIYNQNKNKHSYEVMRVKQLIAKYSKQELTILLLFVLIVIWLFSILSITESDVEETEVYVEEQTSIELVFTPFDEFEQ